jgi:putative cell wall-binding protein
MEVVYETRGWRFIFSPQMSNLEDLEEAKEAMKKAEQRLSKAEKEYDEAKARFTEEWTTTHGLKLTAKYDKDMKSALKEEYENLARKEKIFNDLVNQSQGILLQN